MMRKLTLCLILLLIVAAGCTDQQQRQVQTDVVRAGQTAAADAGKVVQTQVVNIQGSAEPALQTQAAILASTARVVIQTQAVEGQATAQPIIETQAAILLETARPAIETQAARAQETAQPAIETQAANFKATAQAQIATEVVRLLVTRVPGTPLPPAREGIDTYTVVEGDTLASIATQFSIPVDALVQLNRDRYPSLVTDQQHVEAGWVLVVSSRDAGTPTPAPNPLPTPWSDTPGCDVSSIRWLTSPIRCEQSTLDVVTAIGLNLSCVALDGNPLGYSKTHTIYKGWTLNGADNMPSYGWFVDREKNTVEIGPAIIVSQTRTLECGIPRNP